jgi:hypothetical protein
MLVISLETGDLAVPAIESFSSEGEGDEHQVRSASCSYTVAVTTYGAGTAS